MALYAEVTSGWECRLSSSHNSYFSEFRKRSMDSNESVKKQSPLKKLKPNEEAEDNDTKVVKTTITTTVTEIPTNLSDNKEDWKKEAHSMIDKITSGLSIVVSKETAQLILSFAKFAWAHLYSLNIIDEPYYQSSETDGVVLNIFVHWLRLEGFVTGKSKHGAKGSSSTLITGVKGVGKTTLMKGICEIISTLGKHIQTIFLNFENELDFVSISEQFSPAFTTEKFNEDTLKAWCRTNQKAIIFFGDEVQALYKQTKIELRTRISIATQILVIGKCYYSLGIISGSSSDVRTLVHKSFPNDTRHEGFPNLNNSVYIPYKLLPARTPEELQKVLQIKGVTLNTDEQLTKLFKKTGGVGRYVDYIINDLPNSLDIDTSLIAVIESDARLLSLVHQLYTKTEEEGFNVWKPSYINDANYQRFKITSQDMELWCDLSIFYKDSYLGYCFLFPMIHDILPKYFKSIPEKMLKCAMQAVFIGYGGAGSAGAYLEKAVREKIRSNCPPFDSAERCSDKKLSFAKKIKDPDATLYLSKVKSIDELVNVLFPLKADSGLDGFKITLGSDGFAIDILQVKLGQLNREYERGTDSSVDASQFFTPAVKKANKGWNELLEQLQNKFPKHKFKLNSFVLFTSKHITWKPPNSCKFDDIDVPFNYYAHDTFKQLFKNELEACEVLDKNGNVVQQI